MEVFVSLILILLIVLGFVGYVFALVSAARRTQWVWFVLILLFWPLFLPYLLVGYRSRS